MLWHPPLPGCVMSVLPASSRLLHAALLHVIVILAAALAAGTSRGQPPTAPNDEAAVAEQARVLKQLNATVVGVRSLATPGARSIAG